MDHVAMRAKGANLLALRVPGLAERRPSLVLGDFVFAMLASKSGNDTCPMHQVSIFQQVVVKQYRK